MITRFTKYAALAYILGCLLGAGPAFAKAGHVDDITDYLIPDHHTMYAPRSMVLSEKSGINLSGQQLLQSDMTHENYAVTNFHRAVLSESRMKHGLFRGANFSGADLIGVDLRHADLIGANFQGARLLGAELDGAHLNHATYDKHTQFPNYFVPEDHGMVFVPSK